jgi:hypothetical protein
MRLTLIVWLQEKDLVIPLNVAQKSHALWSIMMVVDNRDEVEGIIDPGSQIIAMSEAVCHDIGLAYDLSIKLNMQLANGEVDQSLSLSHNVPCKINTIMCNRPKHRYFCTIKMEDPNFNGFLNCLAKTLLLTAQTKCTNRILVG